MKKHTMEVLDIVELRLPYIFSLLSITVFLLIVTISLWVKSLLFLVLVIEKEHFNLRYLVSYYCRKLVHKRFSELRNFNSKAMPLI